MLLVLGTVKADSPAFCGSCVFCFIGVSAFYRKC